MRAIKRAAAVGTFYGLIAFLALYNVLFHLTTHIPGVGVTDYYHFTWSYWWIRHALTTPGVSVYESNYVFYPSVSNLAYHTLAPIWFPVWAALEPWLGLLSPFAVIEWLAFTLTGVFTYALMRQVGVARGLALLGGVALAVTPTQFMGTWWMSISLLGAAWYPLNLLIWGQIARESARWRRGAFWAVMQGAALWAAALTDLQNTLFLAMLLGPYALWTLRITPLSRRASSLAPFPAKYSVSEPVIGRGRFGNLPWAGHSPAPTSTEPIEFASGIARGERGDSSPSPFTGRDLGRGKARGRLVALGVLALIVFAALMTIAGPFPELLDVERDRFVKAEGGLIYRIPFPDGYLRVGDYWRYNSVGGFVTAAFLFTLLARGWDRQRWIWLALIPIPLLLSPGVEISIGGQTITMPYRWLHDALGGTFRAPGRLGPVFVLPALVYMGLSWGKTRAIHHREHRGHREEEGKSRRRAARYGAVGGLLIAILAHHHVLESVPVQPMPRDYTIYHQMAADPEEYVVIEVPVAAGDGVATVGDPKDLAPMFYGAIHGKPMITGHLSRAYIDYFWYLRTDHPVLSWLGQRRPLEPETVERQLARMIAEYPVGYIVIHQDAIGRDSPTNLEITGFFNTLTDLLCPPTVEGPLVAYRTTWHPDGCESRTPPQDVPGFPPGAYLIDFGVPGDEAYLGWGWHAPETIGTVTWRWAGSQPHARVYVDLPPGEFIMTVSMEAFYEPRRVRVQVNGVPLDGEALVLVGGQAAYPYRIPAAAIGDGQHIEIVFEADARLIPADVGFSADTRPLSVAVGWIGFSRVK